MAFRVRCWSSEGEGESERLEVEVGRRLVRVTLLRWSRRRPFVRCFSAFVGGLRLGCWVSI